MFKKTLIAISLSTMCQAAIADSDVPDLKQLWQIIQQQQSRIEQLEAQLADTNQQLDATSEAVIEVIENPAPSASLASTARWVEKTSIGGYGEHHLNVSSNKDDVIDAHRFVVYVGHQFNDKLRFFSELELEHGLAGEGQPGEVELEQAFIEYDYADQHSIQMGQFLLPIGLLNETHEPETFYGTERNLVEKNIIPTTWWETGTMLKGQLAEGLSYNLAIHSGLNMDPGGKVRNGRQKSANAIANDWAYTGRLKYTAIPGIELGASIQYQADVTQGLDNSSAVLSQLHAVVNKDRFGLRALWAQWNIHGTTFEQNGRDKQEGWYIEPSFKITNQLGVFARYSEYNNEAGSSSANANEYFDSGINYWLSPQVVLKADISNHINGKNDSVNLGVGWSY